MSDQSSSQCTSLVLLSVALVSLVVFLSMSYQFTQVIHDRDILQRVMGQQDKPLQDSRKLQTQLTALAVGTKKLADGGDKSAAAIVARMQQLGINISDQPAPGVAPAPAPSSKP